MKLPPELEKKRDELAEAFRLDAADEEASYWARNGVKEGFNAACELLWPAVEIAVSGITRPALIVPAVGRRTWNHAR